MSNLLLLVLAVVLLFTSLFFWPVSMLEKEEK